MKRETEKERFLRERERVLRWRDGLLLLLLPRFYHSNVLAGTHESVELYASLKSLFFGKMAKKELLTQA
jgi:hypothetical protein